MMTKRLLVLGALLSISAFACASDPNKDANDAHDAELKSERKQLQTNADDRSDTSVNAAEVQRDNTRANATGTTAAKDSTAADAKLTESRDVYRAKATERLEKLDARTAELKALVDKAGGKATTASRDALKTVDTQHAMVAGQLGRLSSVANDDWNGAKTGLTSQLDSLEALVKNAASEVDKFKK
jgi:hypothetical protein